MKKVYFSPVASLLMSLSLALGILVGNLNGYSLLTSAHAQEGGNCGGQGGGNATIVSESVNIEDGLILSGITARNVSVNGTFLEQAVIVGSVKIINATVKNSTNVIEVDGVLIGSGSPCTNGVLIGSGSLTTNGVLIGSGVSAVVSGVSGEATGTAVGGTLTGDDIVISGGSISGHNLLLSGTTIDQGSISGTITSVRIAPAN